MINSLRNAWNYRELLSNLVLRDMKLKYRRSFLGYLWSLLNPIFMMIVVSSIFSMIFVRYSIDQFPLYVLCGQVVFGFFAEATSTAMHAVIGNASLIKKVYVPKYILPVARIASSFTNMLFSLAAILLILVFFRVPSTLNLLLLPVLFLYLGMFITGIGLVLSSWAVYFRDIIHIYSVLLTAWTYFTPIFYPMDMLPKQVQTLVYFNPMYHYITYFRDIVVYGKTPNLNSNLICLLFGGLFLLLGLAEFKKRQNRMILFI